MAEERFLDDFRVGEKSVSGGVTITEGEIIHFALPYKSQSFHPDVTATEKSPYGGLIASGFHSLSLCCRLFMQSGDFVACGIGSPRIDEVRWLAPVRPGDTLRTETEVLEVKPSSSRPDAPGDDYGFRRVFLMRSRASSERVPPARPSGRSPAASRRRNASRIRRSCR